MSRATTILFCLAAVCLSATAMEIEWVHMTGRWAVESAPLVTDLNGDGADEIVAINKGGQLLWWGADGASLGSGADGITTALPEGIWSSSPVRVDAPQGALVLLGNGKGLIIALGPDMQERWRFQLPGETAYGRAVPAVLGKGDDLRIGYMDQTGTFTVLKADGSVAWSKKSDEGKGGASATVVPVANGQEAFLAPLGTKLVCIAADGTEAWSAAVLTADGKPAVVRSRPQMLGGDAIVCLAENGLVVAFGLDGSLRWQLQVAAELDNSLVVWPQENGQPLVVFTGLWGNVYAVGSDGKLLWTSVFRSKNRGVPLIFDADGDGKTDIVQATYAQHLLAFGQDGRLVDDLRLNGLVNPTLTTIRNASGGTDLLAMTGALMAFRVRTGAPHTPYLIPGAVGPVAASWDWSAPGENAALRVDNPSGALVFAHVFAQNTDGSRTIIGRLTTQSLFNLEMPRSVTEKADKVSGEVRAVDGQILARAKERPGPLQPLFPAVVPPAVYAADPFGLFSEQRLNPTTAEKDAAVAVNNLYVGEADQTAFVIAAADEPINARIEIQTPALESGTAFGGAIRCYRVVPVGTVNGQRPDGENAEMVPDALVSLAPAGVVTVPATRAAKVWVSADARGAAPGVYNGKVIVTALPEGKLGELPFRIEVLPLAMPERFPLTLCTWDYVPNRWHPDDTAQVLDDMQRHGVSVFPRGAVPEAAVDANGALQMNYAKLDEELDRLKGRGQILVQIGHPAIAFAAPPTDQAKRDKELEYLRAFRDHLKARGLDYGDYAFYPVDEPGLDYQISNVDALVDAATLFGEADPQLRVYTDPVPTLSMESFERIAPLIDVWCPNMRQVSGLLVPDPRIRRIMDSGAPVWSYECVAQVKSLSPLRYNRANAWRAWYFGLDGIGFWTHSQNTKDMWYPSDDEYALVYPGELPVPSARWESVRDGMEDVAALAQLQEAVAKAKERGAAAEAIQRGEDVLRIAKNDVMELSDAAFVESRDYLAQGDRRIWHTSAEAELYRRNRAAIAEATQALQ